MQITVKAIPSNKIGYSLIVKSHMSNKSPCMLGESSESVQTGQGSPYQLKGMPKQGLLLTISMSVGNYLYAGEIRVKTHFMSRETHFLVQGKRRNQSEHEIQAEIDQNKLKYPSKQA